MTSDEQLASILYAHGKSECPKCGRKIDRADIAWNNGETEDGTPETWVHIQCQACDTGIARFRSWESADNFEELIEYVMPYWLERKK